MKDAPRDAYSTLYIASVNSFGAEPFWVQPTQPRPNNWFYISENNIAAIPPSNIYIEIGRLDRRKMILGEYRLVTEGTLPDLPLNHEGPVYLGERVLDKYRIEFRTDKINYFYVFVYATDDARESAKPIVERFLRGITILPASAMRDAPAENSLQR